MTDTTVSRKIIGTAYPRHYNQPMAEAAYENIQKVGLPEWSEDDQSLAKAVQTEIGADPEGLATELEGAKDETAMLRRAVETLQGERDVLARQVASLTAERAELLEARKALEAVHRALSQASAR